MPIFLLILIQAIWTSSYVAMKIAMVSMPIGLVLILRYGIATLVFLAIGSFRGIPQLTKREWLLVIGVGIANYSLSPFLQLKSLTLTNVIDVSVLVSTEPILTALIASLILRERLTWDLVTVFLISTVGVLLMSGIPLQATAIPMSPVRLVGNLLFILALCCEGANSVTGRHLTMRHSPLTLVAWMHAAGFAANLLFNFRTFSSLPAISLNGWLAILHLGIFCSAVGYGVWYVLVKKIPVSRLALSLFLQPLIGTLFGYFLLKERLSLQTMIGAGLILVSLLVWVIKSSSQKP